MGQAPAVAWRVHPAIGVARVGNSPTEFFLAPEFAGQPTPPSTTYRDLGDPDALLLPRVRRQAARFRIYAYDAADNCLGEVTAATVRTIDWTVSLANRKGSALRSDLADVEDTDPERPRWRNRHIKARWKLEITPRPRQVSGANQRVVFDDGQFMGSPVCLGELRTDSDGRLIVLGGSGLAGTCDAARRIRTHTDNDGWYDDISDGPVSAVIALPDGRVVNAAPAWVVVTPPNFAPGVHGVATLHDLLVDHAVSKGLRQAPGRPSFCRDILPILERIVAMQWLSREALSAFGATPHQGGYDIAGNLAILAQRDVKGKLARELVLSEITRQQSLIQLDHRISCHPGSVPAGHWLELTPTQRKLIQLWAEGEFDSDWPVPGSPANQSAAAAPSPDELDRVALQTCDAAFFRLGSDNAVSFMPGEAFRIDHSRVVAGDLTQHLPCPWQAGFLHDLWPSPVRPREVLTPEIYTAVRELDNRIASAAADESNTELLQLLQDRRAALWMTRRPWARGLGEESPAREERLVKEWPHLGFISNRAANGGVFECAQLPCFVETERSPHLGSMAQYFHWLVNPERHRNFAPKALELALQMLADAKFTADDRFTPFHYTPEAFDARLNRIYTDFVDTIMYSPVPWESGEITWNAIVDYDDDGEPVHKDRRFHLGRFSDRALKERFVQLAPLNLTDGAWLQNIQQAGPIDEVTARLFAIWLDEAGNGRVELNHSNVYATLLRSLNVYMPPVTSPEFIEQDFVPSAFESSVFQLSVGLFPHKFLPELLGLTLYVEWEATPTMHAIAKMMADRQIDPQYYRMHAAIDNVNVGHGALAKEAIKLYLHAQQQIGGDAAVQEHWQRIWRGYVAWSTLGNGADEVIERMMIVDRKQIHLQSSLLLASEILPPLLLALRSPSDPVSAYLRPELGSLSRVLLDDWSPTEPASADLLRCLRKDLNACLRAGIYDRQRFEGVALSERSDQLRRLQPASGLDRIDLGRCLLEDAYPDGVARRAAFPDITRHFGSRMADLIRRKTPIALQSHRGVPWLLNAFHGGPEAVMQMLLDRGLVNVERPDQSRFFEKLEFNGPMYKVFTDAERLTIIEWALSLRRRETDAVRPEPEILVDPAPAVLDLLRRRAAEATYPTAHKRARLICDGVSGSVLDWLSLGPEVLMQALAQTASMVVPGDPDKSPFLRLLAPSGAMANVFSEREVALFRAWIAQGARVPPDITRSGSLAEAVTAESAGFAEPSAKAGDGQSFGERRRRIGMGSVH